MSLNAVQIRTLRTLWISDEIDLHPEFLEGTTVKTTATAGTVSVTLTGLGTGSIAKGSRLLFEVSNRKDAYSVTGTVSIVTNEATVTLSPALISDIPSGTSVSAVPFYRSVFNRATRRLFFSDEELQSLASLAETKWHSRIATAADFETMLFRAIRLLANEQKLAEGSEYLSCLIAEDPNRGAGPGITHLQELVKEDRAVLEARTYGPQNISVWR